MEDASLQSGAGRKRNLTAAQLAHKRELDRRAQRTNREKTKNKIAHLESLVGTLRGSDDKTTTFIEQIDHQKAEIERLQNVLNNIVHMAGGAKPSEPGALQDTTPIQCADSPQRKSSDAGPITGTPIKSEAETDPSTHNDSNSLPTPPHIPPPCDTDVPETAAIAPAQTKYLQLSSRQSLTQMATELFTNTATDGLMWFFCAILLRHVMATVPPSSINFENDDDIAIRAIFEGWGSVVERYPLDPGWQWLKEVDERIYFHRGEPFRLMHLRNCRLIFLRQMFRGGEWDSRVPPFYAPRGAEQNMDHDPLIEYFAWPGLRERMVFSPTMFATTKFMETLRCEVDFVWSDNVHKLYDWNPATQCYSYSDMYHKRILDLGCYQATADFFSNFPELKTDIPSCPNALRLMQLSMSRTKVATKRKRQGSPISAVGEEGSELVLSPRSLSTGRRSSELADGVVRALATNLPILKVVQASAKQTGT